MVNTISTRALIKRCSGNISTWLAVSWWLSMPLSQNLVRAASWTFVRICCFVQYFKKPLLVPAYMNFSQSCFICTVGKESKLFVLAWSINDAHGKHTLIAPRSGSRCVLGMSSAVKSILGVTGRVYSAMVPAPKHLQVFIVSEGYVYILGCQGCSPCQSLFSQIAAGDPPRHAGWWPRSLAHWRLLSAYLESFWYIKVSIRSSGCAWIALSPWPPGLMPDGEISYEF